MAEVSLALLKKELRIQSDFTDQDEILTLDLEAAEDAIVRWCNRDIEELKFMGGGVFPAQLKKAELALAKHMFTHDMVADERSLNATPYGISTLVKPYVKLVSDED